MFERLPVEVAFQGRYIIYRRGVVEKHLPKGRLIYTPLPPVYVPRRFAAHLMIEFPVQVIAPKEKRKLYLKFPIDVGVFLELENQYTLIDAFSLAKVKYALYCDPRNGVLARWWRSQAFAEPPRVHADSEGIMELEIVNIGGEWAEVSRGVFGCSGMPIYYSSYAAVKARIDVRGKHGETYFIDAPLLEDMVKAPSPRITGEERFDMRCGL